MAGKAANKGSEFGRARRASTASEIDRPGPLHLCGLTTTWRNRYRSARTGDDITGNLRGRSRASRSVATDLITDADRIPEADFLVDAARATLRLTQIILIGAWLGTVVLTGIYLWGSWDQTSREAWSELQALSNLAQSTAQTHFDQYARGMEQFAAQALLLEQHGKGKPDLGALVPPFLHAYPDLSGVILVRPGGQLVASSTPLNGAALRRFAGNPQLTQMLASMNGRVGLQFFPPVISPLTHKAVIRLVFPARAANGKLLFYIVAGLDLDRQTARWRSLLTDMEVRNHFGIGVLTQDGYLLENWPMSMQATPSLVAFLAQPRTGAVREAMLRDSRALQAPVVGAVNIGQAGIYWGMFKRLSGYSAAAFVVVPREVVVSRWWHRVRLALMLELLALIGSAWFVRRTLRSQRQSVVLAQQQTDQRKRLERLQGLYQALLSAGNVILRSSSDVDMLNGICKDMATCGLFEAVWVAQPNAEGRLHAIAASDSDIAKGVDQLALEVSETVGPTGRAWVSGCLEYDNDYRDDPTLDGRRATLDAMGWVSGLAVPIQRGSHRYAVLALAGRHTGLFDEEVRTLVAQIALQVGQGLDDLDLKRNLEQELMKQDYLARHDVLTNLPNRLEFLERLPPALARARRQKTMLAVGLLDLDDFKPVNDTWGHAAGDAILQELGRRLINALRETDFVARLGGDEFAFLLEGLTHPESLSLAVARIHATVEEPFALSGGRIARVGLSLGVTLYPQDDEDADTLLNHADTALYAVKDSKGKRATWWRLWNAAA